MRKEQTYNFTRFSADVLSEEPLANLNPKSA
jgi:hypothetical protein